jgi:hypothetical protein
MGVQRNRVHLTRLKDWQRIATRFDRCAHTFPADTTLAAIVIFWLGK